MAIIHVDLDLATGLDDGTSWADAFQDIQSVLNGTASSSGDIVYVKGSQADLPAAAVLQGGTTLGYPIVVMGVKAATTNEDTAIVTSDLIPGWRTGETRTEANLAYNDGALPSIDQAGGNDDLSVRGQIYFYGLSISSQDNWSHALATGGPTHVVYEECELKFDQMVPGSASGNATYVIIKNCHTNQRTNEETFTGNDTTWVLVIGGKYTNVTGANTDGFIGPESHDYKFIGWDISAAAHNIYSISTTMGTPSPVFQNCLLHASTSLLVGTRTNNNFRLEMHGCTDDTGLTSGTIKALDIATDAGDIVVETTAIRTGGAADSDAGWSLAYTPVVDGTRDQYYGMVGPWMAFAVTSSATTVTVYIANDSSATYQDDEVYLEVMSPSDLGTAQHQFATTQADLLATPSNITTDASTWGTGAADPQKLQATIAPDFDGIAYCRVVFAKHFSATPDILYVDPLPEVS